MGGVGGLGNWWGKGVAIRYGIVYNHDKSSKQLSERKRDMIAVGTKITSTQNNQTITVTKIDIGVISDQITLDDVYIYTDDGFKRSAVRYSKMLATGVITIES